MADRSHPFMQLLPMERSAKYARVFVDETLCKCKIRTPADESYDSTRVNIFEESERGSMPGWREIIEHDSRMHAERLFLVNHQCMRAKIYSITQATRAIIDNYV